MAGRGQNIAFRQRAIRQEALRDQLRSQKLIESLLGIAGKLENLDKQMDAIEVARLKASADIKKGLIAKFLPDLKQVEAIVPSDNERDITDLSDAELADIAAGRRLPITLEAERED